MTLVSYSVILLAALLAVASPGPATLAIANESANRGIGSGIWLALGVTTGSLLWLLAAALGFAALLQSYSGLLIGFKLVGAGYLFWLAWALARRAVTPNVQSPAHFNNRGQPYFRGMLIHLTNPKPVLFFAALFSVGIPTYATPAEVLLISILVLTQGFIVFQAYALLFAIPSIRRGYLRSKRWFDGAVALLFGAAGVSLLWSDH